jgi:hypothetical protein
MIRLFLKKRMLEYSSPADPPALELQLYPLYPIQMLQSKAHGLREYIEQQELLRAPPAQTVKLGKHCFLDWANKRVEH